MFDVTSLALMPWFNIVLGMVPDYMHGCLLGITKTLLYKWFSSTNYKKEYFIGGQVQLYKPSNSDDRLHFTWSCITKNVKCWIP